MAVMDYSNCDMVGRSATADAYRVCTSPAQDYQQPPTVRRVSLAHFHTLTSQRGPHTFIAALWPVVARWPRSASPRKYPAAGWQRRRAGRDEDADAGGGVGTRPDIAENWTADELARTRRRRPDCACCCSAWVASAWYRCECRCPGQLPIGAEPVGCGRGCRRRGRNPSRHCRKMASGRVCAIPAARRARTPAPCNAYGAFS